MKCASVLLFLAFFGGTWRLGRATCVLESDFGFVINCAFKKSGLFRVRNLGGLKAHVGLGFSLGDELGFKESISNTEVNKRRSAQASPLQVAAIQAQQAQQTKQAAQLNSLLTQTQAAQTAKSLSPPRKKMSDIPPFKPIPPAAERPAIPTMIALNATKLSSGNNGMPTPTLIGVAVPAYNKLAISRLSTSANEAKPIGLLMPINKKKIDISDNLNGQNFGSLDDLPAPLPVQASNSVKYTPINLTEAAIEAMLLQRHQQVLQQQAATTTTTTTTRRPNRLGNIGKVMNAPKEYYPVGYDKNFDDNFSSRVELPETSFYCGDQKHFPGLYADEDLGCMVFHVCALTDDGLIMKSFLCPESTLFDQTILKCNWWFYVDCKNSKKLYDSNIPISKSYQLMKALTFFSAYKKETATTTSTEKD